MISRAILCLGAAMRLTRFIVADDVPGRWWIKDPIDRAMARDYARRQDAHWVGQRMDAEANLGTGLDGLGDDEWDSIKTDPEQPWWYRYRDGLDCPFCVGQWVAFAVVAAEALTARHPHSKARGAWTGLAAALTLNESAAHLGARLGDTSD